MKPSPIELVTAFGVIEFGDDASKPETPNSERVTPNGPAGIDTRGKRGIHCNDR